MPRSPYSASYTFGPGPVTPAVKGLLWANVGAFLLWWIVGAIADVDLILFFGLQPEAVFERFSIWQLATYMFLHADLFHLLMNMLVLWMFGVDLERRWGFEPFLRYYTVCGVGAALTTLAASWLPFGFADGLYQATTVGASGAIYGLLVAFGLLYPDRVIYLYFLFPVPARVFVMITVALVVWSSINEPFGGTAHLAHLGGMLFGYVYLARGRGGPWAELKYRYVRWRMNRYRRRFGVHQGGRGWDDRVH